jgi:hypothetical protein
LPQILIQSCPGSKRPVAHLRVVCSLEAVSFRRPSLFDFLRKRQSQPAVQVSAQPTHSHADPATVQLPATPISNSVRPTILGIGCLTLWGRQASLDLKSAPRGRPRSSCCQKRRGACQRSIRSVAHRRLQAPPRTGPRSSPTTRSSRYSATRQPLGRVHPSFELL